MTGAGFPHSDIHGSKLSRQLPVAFRSQTRPSSVLRRQGIHRWLFVAWKNKDARARYAILKELAEHLEARLGRRRRDADDAGSRPASGCGQRTQRTEETMAADQVRRIERELQTFDRSVSS